MTNTSAPGKTGRTWVLGSVATLIGLVLALAIAELVLRVFDLAPAGGLATVTQHEFEQVPGIFAPREHLVERMVPQLPYHITIDSLGYRAVREMPRRKPAGEVRILMLGDSFTFGYLVDDDKTLPAQLERLLQSRCGREVRVINAGVGGTSIETAAEMALRADPLGIDAVVLTFTENDVTDLATSMWDDLAANRRAKSRFPLSVFYPVARRMALWNLLLEARSRLRSTQAPGQVTMTRLPTAEQSRQTETGRTVVDSQLGSLRAQYQRRLVALRDSLSARHIPLVFAVYPSHLTVYGKNHDEQVRWVEGIAREAGLPTVDLLTPLQQDGRSKEELYLFPYDGHPSAAGYAVVAPAIDRTVESLEMLAGRCNSSGVTGATPGRP